MNHTETAAILKLLKPLEDLLDQVPNQPKPTDYSFSFRLRYLIQKDKHPTQTHTDILWNILTDIEDMYNTNTATYPPDEAIYQVLSAHLS